MSKTVSKFMPGIAAALAIVLGAGSVASAETLLMPTRDYLMGTSEVVWGVTTQANATPFVLDYGDGSAQQTGNVVDRSYIAFNHTYAISGTFTVQLCVGAGAAIPACPGELATVQVDVYNAALLSDFDERALNVNRAIQDGLRYLWTAQLNRTTNFPAGVTTEWGSGSSYGPAYAALIVLAFQNHGYTLPNNNNAPTGLYEKYVVQRGINHVASILQPLTLTAQPAGNPCVGGLADPCIGLYHTFDPGYSNAVVALPFASSTALSRNIPAGVGNATYVAGKPMGQVLQRIMNASAFGQNDFNINTNSGRGGWIYQFANNQVTQSDGSTVGWDVLAQLDAAAAGAVIPAFVKPEFGNHALLQGLNNDGSFDYRADNSPTGSNGNIAKAGIGLQGLFWTGTAAGNARVLAGIDYISDRWGGASLGQDFACSNGTFNKGCGYAMFNVFKAFKLYGVDTIPGVTRPAGPGPIPAGDWYADYVDWLLANQTSPTTLAGGSWNNLDFSCCESFNSAVNAALAELILAPVALIQPDPTLFSTVGLSPANAVNPPGTSHTVTASALSATNTPVPGATVNFTVLTGPNAGKNGTDVTDANGEATFTYTDTSVGPYPKTDTIQAFIGNLGSNVVSKTWAEPTIECDIDADSDVDMADLLLIRNANGQNPGANNPRDANKDGRINVADVRYCQLRLTPP